MPELEWILETIGQPSSSARDDKGQEGGFLVPGHLSKRPWPQIITNPFEILFHSSIVIIFQPFCWSKTHSVQQITTKWTCPNNNIVSKAEPHLDGPSWSLPSPSAPKGIAALILTLSFLFYDSTPNRKDHTVGFFVCFCLLWLENITRLTTYNCSLFISFWYKILFY